MNMNEGGIAEELMAHTEQEQNSTRLTVNYCDIVTAPGLVAGGARKWPAAVNLNIDENKNCGGGDPDGGGGSGGGIGEEDCVTSGVNEPNEHSKGLHWETEKSNTVESSLASCCSADPHETGSPPSKKPRSMEAVTSPGSSRSVGQRLSDSSLKESQKSSPSSAGSVVLSSPTGAVSPDRLTQAQKNTVRIIAQYLTKIGLQKSASMLVSESGCRIENGLATSFRSAILNGEWIRAIKIVDKIAEVVESVDQDRFREVRARIVIERYAELLVQGSAVDALQLISSELSTNEHAALRDDLSKYLFYDPKNRDISKLTGAHGTVEEREQLFMELQKSFPVEFMLPADRLQQLMMQAWKTQCSSCFLHGKSRDLSDEADYILRDHVCDWATFPMFQTEDKGQSAEVSCASYSPCGEYLATGSRSGPITIWKVVSDQKIEELKTLGDQIDCTFLSWSLDSSLIAVSPHTSPNASIDLYSLAEGTVMSSMDCNGYETVIVKFFPGSPYSVVFGDLASHFGKAVVHGTKLDVVGKFEGYRIRGLHCLDSHCVLAADSHNRVRSYNFTTMGEQTLFILPDKIVNFSVDRKNNRALITTHGCGICLYDLNSNELLKKFHGAYQENYCILPCFAGSELPFVASGSADGKTLIWNTETGKVVVVLSAHLGTVNAVDWHPFRPQLVSVSEDKTIKIWSELENVPSSLAFHS